MGVSRCPSRDLATVVVRRTFRSAAVQSTAEPLEQNLPRADRRPLAADPRTAHGADDERTRTLDHQQRAPAAASLTNRRGDERVDVASQLRRRQHRVQQAVDPDATQHQGLATVSGAPIHQRRSYVRPSHRFRE